MRAAVQHPAFRSAHRAPGPGITPAVRRAAMVEAAQARLCAATRRGDPLDVEAAARAFGWRLALAGIARAGGDLGAMAPALWRRIRGLAADPATRRAAGPGRHLAGRIPPSS